MHQLCKTILTQQCSYASFNTGHLRTHLKSQPPSTQLCNHLDTAENESDLRRAHFCDACQSLLLCMSLRVAHVALLCFLPVLCCVYLQCSAVCLALLCCIIQPVCLSTALFSLCVLLSLPPACEPVSSSCGNPSHSLAPQPPDSPL